MDTPRRTRPGPDGSGKNAAGRALAPSRGRLAIVLLLVLAGAAALWMLLAPPTPDPGATVAVASAPPAASPPPPPPTGPNAMQKPDSRLPEGDADPTRDLSSYVARGENPSMGEVIQRLHERGIHSGLGAFSPPGTSPPLVGLAVPEDFVLPKGYVRHHQATDDGQRIEAILMFHPDFQMVDASNRPVDMPKNRVVPPELAPAGMPIRRIVIPPPTEPNR